LVSFIGIDEYGVPGAEIVPLFPEQNPAGAVRDDHSVLVPMLIERRLPARRDGEVADDKIGSSFGYPQQDLLGNARRCDGAIIA
jgi:hypothetical protein